MKEFFMSRKNVLTFSLAAALFVIPFAASEMAAKKINSIKTLGAGSTTCFTRVGQTFTALMIKDFSSDYLGKGFRETTGECFGELNKNFEHLFGASFVAAKKPLNKLASDLFWFHEKTEKLVAMSKDGAIELTPSSNILNKFSSLEALNAQFQDQLDQKSSSLAFARNIWIGFSLFGALLLGGLALVTGRSRQQERKRFDLLNKEAEELLENELDSDMIHAKTSRLMEHVFRTIQAPYCFELFSKVQGDYLENSAASLPPRPENETSEPAVIRPAALADAKESSNFNSIARALVDRFSSTAFTHGIILDERLEEDFWVEGNAESLEQLLYNLLSFSTENSLHHSTGRKISVRSRALGGIAYLKAKVSNHLLNPDELELFNGNTSYESKVSTGANVNLLLLREISSDLGATVTAKNIINGSNFTGAEIEIVFKRVKPQALAASSQKSSKLKNLMKGKKKDLLRALSSEA